MSRGVIEIGSNVKPYFTSVIFIISLIFICSSKNVITKYMPIGRAGASIIGATLMVYFGIVPPNEIGQVINWDTIILLMAMMMLSNYMEMANIWGIASNLLLYKCKTPISFMIRVCLISAVMSSILTNDTVCVTLTPIVINACRTSNLPLFPFLMSVATSANIGSSALPVGNPQNMIIATAGGLNFFKFFKVSIVSSILGVIINTTLLYLYYRKELINYTINIQQISISQLQQPQKDEDITKITITTTEFEEPVIIESNIEMDIYDNTSDLIINNNNSILNTTIVNPIAKEEGGEYEELSLINEYKIHENENNSGSSGNNNKIKPKIIEILKLLFKFRVAIILLIILIGFFIGMHMGFTVLFGVSILMIMERKDISGIIKNGVDWELLLFFSGLFVLVDGFDRQFAKEAWVILEPFVPIDSSASSIIKILIFSILVLILCNVLGNVPLVLSLCPRLLNGNAPSFTWLLLAFVSTIGGNLTLIGSVANLIVAEKAKQYHTIEFSQYLKFGFPSTILVILAGVPIIVFISS